MDNRQDRGEENPGWLDLRLGQSPGETCSHSRAASLKVYACNFCRRKFYSSQALGGHQNAHRRERDITRRYQQPKMVNLPMTSALNLSVGVQAHSVVHTTYRNGEPTLARLTNNGTGRHGDGVVSIQHNVVEEKVDVNWPGGVYLDQQQASQRSDRYMLDLNLSL